MKGILFKPDMIKAIVEGRKTVTRRVIKPQPDSNGGVDACNTVFDHNAAALFARYQVGETVYIKEAWATYRANDDWAISQIPDTATIFYRLDDPDGFSPIGKWRSPMFLKDIHARYFIKIKDVRAERLQEITEKDILKEGITKRKLVVSGGYAYSYSPEYHVFNARLAYKLLWDSINKPPYDWDSNPWVWRYEFELTGGSK